MYLHMIAVGDASAVFFVMLQIFGKYVLLNLFLAILLENFEEIETQEETLREETSLDTVDEMTPLGRSLRRARKERSMWSIIKYAGGRCLKALGLRRARGTSATQVASVPNDDPAVDPHGSAFNSQTGGATAR